MSSQSLYILWDESQIWGLLAWRSALGLGLPFRMVKAGEVKGGLLKKSPPAMLMVPGGTARLKAESLGPDGMQAIRGYVADGGHYIGFCGGAGLGLSAPADKEQASAGLAEKKSAHHIAEFEESLGLCPWSRGAYEDRMQHFMSGHLEAEFPMPGHHLGPGQANPEHDACTHTEPPLSGVPLLPVWWPGRFLPEVSPKASALAGEVSVLARYGAPGKDFWLADLPVALLPENAFSDWQYLYGISLSPAFLTGQPCLVHGSYGAGTYTLSYSHLETPASPYANHWLAHILRTLGGIELKQDQVPAWELDKLPVKWADSGLASCFDKARGLVKTGLEHNLLFRRNEWLFGWRTGMPGLPLTSLYAVLASIVSLPATPAARELWQGVSAELLKVMESFADGATNYLLAERLAMTLSKSAPGTVSSGLLSRQREVLFGSRMRSGGLYKQLMDVFDELAYLQIEGNRNF